MILVVIQFLFNVGQLRVKFILLGILGPVQTVVFAHIDSFSVKVEANT